MLFRNTAAATIALLTGYVFSFILAPVMLARLGLTQFGVWAVTGAFATYAGLMDLGITRALGRFIAFYNANDDRRSVERLWTLGLLAVSSVGLVAELAAVLAAPVVAGALDDVLSTGDTRIVLCSSVAIGVLNAARSVMRAVPEGMERFVEPNVSEVAFNVTNFVLSLAALFASRDLVTYALANVVAAVLGLGYAFLALRRVTGPLRLSRPPRVLVRETVGFSVKNQLAWIADLSAGQAAKVLIALLVDVRAAGAFEIANRAVVAAKAVAAMSVGAMVPTATSRLVNEGKGIVEDFYRQYNVRSLSVSLPLLAFISAAAPALLVTWLGDVPSDSMGIFILLTLANCVNLTTGVGYVLSLGEGKATAIAWISGFGALLGIGSMAALAPSFGVWGAVAGSMTGVIGSALTWIVHFHRSRGIPATAFLRSVVPPALACLLAAAPVALSWLVVGAPDGRPRALVLTIIDAAVFFGIYLPLAERLDMLPHKLRAGSAARAVLRRRRANAGAAGPF